MFLRRMFSRKDIESEDKPTSTPKLQRKMSAGASVLQLTPLWEYIIRTRKLPSNIPVLDMFDEFSVRLQDPEWQVRQHALRVLYDVLAVLNSKSDMYMPPLIPKLVENLGHPAPTVRKGALDSLRMYLAETEVPENVIIQILDMGLNQRISNEPYGGRMTCGVMLSLPALIQSTLHTKKRNYILRTTIDMLVSKMTHVTHQDITLKVLTKLKELIGPREFSEYMSHAAFREYELLCSVYGVGEKRHMHQSEPKIQMNSSRSSWKLMSSSFDSDDPKESDGYWRSSDEERTLNYTFTKLPSITPPLSEKTTAPEKIIMETEIKINNDTVTMRILEEGDKEDSSSTDDDCVTGGSIIEPTGLIQVFTDSEVDEVPAVVTTTEVKITTPRTPKRVTFGGEVVKMRTPDSDVSHEDVNKSEVKQKAKSFDLLTIEISNDNTKSPPTLSPSQGTQTSPPTSQPTSPSKQSPRSPFKRLNLASVDSIVSPKTQHKQIEVLHNLQRDPSPSRSTPKRTVDPTPSKQPSPPPKNWEDLGIVSDDVLQNLKSGDWRLRANAICSIEEALKQSDNLLKILPCLDNLLRTLLSSERHAEVAEDKRRVVTNLISRLPLDNLEDRTVQILTGLCRQGGPGSNRVSKALMQRLPPAVIVLKLTSDEFLHAKSSRFRENALQMVMYALMTFPSTCFDTTTCVTQVTYAAFDRKKRIRQASLAVLAILGQVSSPNLVLDVVHDVAMTRDFGSHLFAAVKARLSRKQLPNVSTDGTVQYVVRVPTPSTHDPSELSHLGADIEWIAAGIGSVSPTSIKRRMHLQYQHGCQHHHEGCTDMSSRRSIPPHELLGLGVGVKDEDGAGSCPHGMAPATAEDNNRQSNQMRPTATANGKGDMLGLGVNGRRISLKSCSDSSLDGRSSDSTYTNSSGGFECCGCGAGSTGRWRNNPNAPTKLPIVDKLKVSGTGFSRQYRNPYDEMTNYTASNKSHLNSTYPKLSHSFYHRKQSKGGGRTLSSQEISKEIGEKELAATVTGATSTVDGKRFVNVEKFKNGYKSETQLQRTTSFTTDMNSNFNGNHNNNLNANGTVPAANHTNVNGSVILEDGGFLLEKIEATVEKTMVAEQPPTPVEEPPSPLPEKEESPRPPPMVSEAVESGPSSLKSITIEEEIENDSAPPVRPPSIKSIQPIDEEIEEEVAADEVDKAVTAVEDVIEEENEDVKDEIAEPLEIEEITLPEEEDKPLPSPTIEEIKSLSRRSSMAKSCESIYQRPPSAFERRPQSKTEPDNKSTGSSESNSEQSRGSLEDSFTCLKSDQGRRRKSIFSKNHRRVSPVKQSIKMVKGELFPQSLPRFDRPKEGLSKAFDSLDSANWEDIITGLRSLIRLIRHHPDTIDNQMHMVCIQLTKSVRNLRSQVARAACQASTEIFPMKSKNLESECDDLVASLLHRTADTNRFLRADAYRALESMCDNLASGKVLHLLTTKGANHQNAIVRTTTAKLLNRLADRLGCEKIYSLRDSRDKFFQTGANLMLEGSLETRSYAKALFRLLASNVNFNRVCLEVIPVRTYRNIEKTLKSILK